MKKKIFGMVLMLLPWLAQAALQVDTINGLVYDPVLDVTWLKTPNFAKQDLTDARVTQIITDVGTVAGHTLVQTDFFKDNTGYSGNMTWWGAKAWVQTLNYQGIPGWRLPKITQFDATTGDPVNSELTDLYNREGLLGMTATFGNVQLANAVPADNSAFYWIDNEVSVNGSPIAASIVSGIDGSLAQV